MKEEEVALTFDTDDEPVSKSARHPVATFFHLLFRVGALLAYALCGWFSYSYVTSFVAVVLLCAFDFWTVKNVTGRLMVGLRWWNQVDSDGNTQWKFECRKKGPPPFPSEYQIFWISLIVCPVLWVFFTISCIFTLKANWLMLSLVGALMTLANLYGYVRCVQGQKSVKSMATEYLGQQVLKEALSQATKTGEAPAQ